eukprot:UN03933
MLRSKTRSSTSKQVVAKKPKVAKKRPVVKSHTRGFKKVGQAKPQPITKPQPKPTPEPAVAQEKTTAEVVEEPKVKTITHVPIPLELDLTGRKPKTGILMLNMGGPADPKDTKDFLVNLFTDPMIINLGKFQFLGKRAGESRAEKVQKQYEKIGGSPIGFWTDEQGKEFTKILDITSPQTAPHKHYVSFRYAEPSTATALKQLKADGVKDIIAFSQYPMWSCTTTGSSLNDLWQKAKEEGMTPENGYSFSVVDRWHDNTTFHQAIAHNIKDKVRELAEERGVDALKDTVVLFSAHSIPLKTMNGGDQYPAEISSSVEQSMVQLNSLIQEDNKKNVNGITIPKIPHILCWQSKVGFLPWLRPSTSEVLENVTKLGYKKAIIVPVAFTSDHIETLHEIDIEYQELAHKSGVELIRAESLNTSMHLIKAQSSIVQQHIAKNEIVSSHQYRVKCLACVQPEICRTVLGYNEEELFYNQKKTPDRH